MFKNKDGSYNKIQIILVSLIFIIGLIITGIYISETVEIPQIKIPIISIIPTTQVTPIQTIVYRNISYNESVYKLNISNNNESVYNWSVNDAYINISYYENQSNTSHQYINNDSVYNNTSYQYISNNSIDYNNTFINPMLQINKSVNQTISIFTSNNILGINYFIWIILSILLITLFSFRGYSVLLPLTCITLVCIYIFNVDAILVIPGLMMALIFFHLNR